MAVDIGRFDCYPLLLQLMVTISSWYHYKKITGED